MAVTNNQRVHCHGQAKSFTMQDLFDLINNGIDSNAAPDDQLKLSGNSGVIVVQDLIDLILLGSSANVSTDDVLHAGGQSATIGVLEIVQFFTYTLPTDEIETP